MEEIIKDSAAMTKVSNQNQCSLSSEELEGAKIPLERGQHFSEMENFSDPLSANSTLLPVLLFDLDMLPDALQPWIKDIAYRKQCPIDFVAIPAIVMFASLIGARCSIKPHERDDWTVVPNLWGGILGDPGTLKSPVCSEVLFPFGYLEAKAKEDYENKKTNYDAEKAVFLETKSSLERKIKDVLEEKAEGDLASLKDQLASLLKNAPSEPTFTRYKISDTTLEKMHEILSHNSKGVLVYRDELMGFLESWEKKGHESDRSFYLEAWNGIGTYSMDRIGRGTVQARNICVSVLGTTQPDRMATYLHRAIKQLDNDGLFQRFQLLVYPDKRTWKLVDEFPDSSARNRVFDICKTIDTMQFKDYGAIEPKLLYEGQYSIPFFRLSSEAQPFFHNWLENHYEKPRNHDHPILIQHLSKYKSLMPSLALIFHVINIADGQEDREVPLSSVQKAAAWCEYLESHARRIYGIVLNATPNSALAQTRADELLAWMRKQSSHTNQSMKRRLILRYSKFRNSKDLDPLLSDLAQRGYIQEDPQNNISLIS